MCKGDMKRHCNIIIPDKNEYETMLNIADAKVKSRIYKADIYIIIVVVIDILKKL